MKLLILLLFPLALSAGGFGELAKVQDGTIKTVYTSEGKCKKLHVDCIEMKIESVLSDYDIQDEMIDGDPIYSAATNSTVCSGEEDCYSKLESLVCDDETYSKFINQDYTQLYCTKILDYEQITSGKKILVLNQAKKDARLAEKAIKDAEKAAKKAAKDAAKEKIDKLNCQSQSKMDKDLCEFIQGL